MNFSFAGGGFQSFYHMGVLTGLRKHGVHLQRAAGASAGAMCAAFHICNSDLGVVISELLKGVTEANKRTLGLFSPAVNVNTVFRRGMEQFLPVNAHELCSGRLFISVTRISDKKNVLLSQFSSRDELIDAIMCSAFVPVISGIIPDRVNGVQYIDGGFTDNLPRLDDKTITISPFSGEEDICPRDNTPLVHLINLKNTSMEVSMKNFQRMINVVWPPSPEVFYRMCEQGYLDTVNFLQRNNLIKCSNCLNMERLHYCEAPLKLKGILPHSQEVLDCEHCRDCNLSKQEALLDHLPEVVDDVLKFAIDKARTNYIEYFFQFKLMKLIALTWLPLVLLYDLLVSLYCKSNEYYDFKDFLRTFNVPIIILIFISYIILES